LAQKSSQWVELKSYESYKIAIAQGYDWTPAFNQAKLTGKSIFLPAETILGNFVLDYDNANMMGAIGLTIITPADPTKPAITVTKGRDTNLLYAQLSNFVLQGTSGSIVGLQLQNVHEWDLYNIIVSGFTDGVIFIGSWNGSVTKLVSTYNNGHGVIVDSATFTNGNEQNAASITFQSCFIKNNGSDGYLFKTGDYGTSENSLITIIGGDCEGNGGYGVNVQATVHNLKLISPHFEANTLGSLYSASVNTKIFIDAAGIRPVNISGYGYLFINGLTSTDNGQKVLDLSNFYAYDIKGVSLKHAPLSGNIGSSYIVETNTRLAGVKGIGNKLTNGNFRKIVNGTSDPWTAYGTTQADLIGHMTYVAPPTGFSGQELLVDTQFWGANTGFDQRFKANAGDRITLHFWAFVDSSSQAIIFSLRGDGTSNYSEITINNTSPKRYTIQWIVPTGLSNPDPYLLIRTNMAQGVVGKLHLREICVHNENDLKGYLLNASELTLA
jgi:hypothetical protein